jgi:hypothetical protein
MSELLQFIIVAAFGALCFGGGYLTAFIVTRNHWRDEDQAWRRPLQLADRQMGMGRAAERTDDVGSAMIQSAKARRTTELPELLRRS